MQLWAVGRLLGGSWAVLGRLVAPRHLFAPLGTLLAVLEASWLLLGHLLGRLGQHFGRLGCILEASWSDFYAPIHSLSSAFHFDRLLD